MQAGTHHVSEATTQGMPNIPPEVLQTIFRNLELFGLIRCQQVCKMWRAYLPGDDSKLRDKLFMSQPQGSENDGNDCKDNHRIPTLSIDISAHAEIFRIPGIMSWLNFCLQINFHRFVSGNTHFFPDGTTLNPLFKNLEKHIDLISDSLFRGTDDNKHDWFDFTSFEQLVVMISGLKEVRQEDGKWKDLPICIPATKDAKISFLNSTFPGPRRTFELHGEDGAGVTMGQCIQAFRDQLKLSEEDFRGYADTLELQELEKDRCVDR